MTRRRAVWVIPTLHTEGDEGIERRVTWLGLFSYLFFVVTIAGLAPSFAIPAVSVLVCFARPALAPTLGREEI